MSPFTTILNTRLADLCSMDELAQALGASIHLNLRKAGAIQRLEALLERAESSARPIGELTPIRIQEAAESILGRQWTPPQSLVRRYFSYPQLRTAIGAFALAIIKESVGGNPLAQTAVSAAREAAHQVRGRLGVFSALVDIAQDTVSRAANAATQSAAAMSSERAADAFASFWSEPEFADENAAFRIAAFKASMRMSLGDLVEFARSMGLTASLDSVRKSLSDWSEAETEQCIAEAIQWMAGDLWERPLGEVLEVYGCTPHPTLIALLDRVLSSGLGQSTSSEPPLRATKKKQAKSQA